MRIQTAGEQKYYDFIQERANRQQTGMIVWGSILAVAFISIFSNIAVAAALAAAGILIATWNLKARRELGAVLEAVGDKEEFFRQLTAPDTVEIPDCHVIITRDYILAGKEKIVVLAIADVKKIEKRTHEGTKKTVCLTDQQGRHYEIASAKRGSRAQQGLERLYSMLEGKIDE